MAGEGHEHSETVRDHERLRPPSFRSGCGLSGKRSPCGLIGPRPLDVTASTFYTTNRQEGGVGSAGCPIRKGRGAVSEAANGRQEAEPPWERRRELFRVPEAGQVLDPWRGRKGRGERCVQCPLAVALPEAHGVPDPGKGGEGDRGAGRARVEAPERAPRRSPDPLAFGGALRSGWAGRSVPLPGRLCPDVWTRPWTGSRSTTSQETELISFLPGFFLFFFLKIEVIWGRLQGTC